MRQIDQPEVDQRFEAIRQFEEWRDVAARFSGEEMPRCLDAFADPADSNQPGYESLFVAAGLKAALNASYFVGEPGRQLGPKTQLHIASLASDPESGIGFYGDLENGGGAFEPFWVKLNGRASAPIIQVVGSMASSKLLQETNSDWGLLVKSGGDSNPYIRARFTSLDGDAPKLGLHAAYRHYPASRNRRNPDRSADILVGDFEVPMDEADPEITKATLALASAVTRWITKPEGATRNRVPAVHRPH